MARKDHAGHTPAGNAQASPEPDARQVMVSFSMSEPAHFALKTRALHERTTVKAVVMKALKAFGIEVPDDELVDRRAGRAGRPKGR